MAKFNHIDVRGTKKVPSAFGNVFISADSISAAKTVTFPDGYLNGATPEPNLAFKVVFANGHNAANASSYLSLNGIVVVSNQNGVLAPIPIHAMTEGGSTVYKVLQANTVLELYYTADYDGNNAPAFVVIGNPVVLSSADYTIYANGQNNIDGAHPIGSTYVQYPGQKSPNTLWGAVSVWTEIDYKGVFFRAKGNGVKSDGVTLDGNNANAFSTSVNGGVQQEGLPNIYGYVNSSDMSPVYLNSDVYQSDNKALRYENFTKKSRTGSSTGTSNYPTKLEFNANWCNSIYGNSSHVTPKNQTVVIWERTA